MSSVSLADVVCCGYSTMGGWLHSLLVVECLYRDKPIHWNRFKINCTSMSSGPESDERRDLFVEYVVYLYHKYNCRGSVVGWSRGVSAKKEVEVVVR